MVMALYLERLSAQLCYGRCPLKNQETAVSARQSRGIHTANSRVEDNSSNKLQAMVQVAAQKRAAQRPALLELELELDQPYL
jgi:hypothetical protein